MRFRISLVKVITIPPATVSIPLARCEGSWPSRDRPRWRIPKPSRIRPTAQIREKMKPLRFSTICWGGVRRESGNDHGSHRQHQTGEQSIGPFYASLSLPVLQRAPGILQKKIESRIVVGYDSVQRAFLFSQSVEVHVVMVGNGLDLGQVERGQPNRGGHEYEILKSCLLPF